MSRAESIKREEAILRFFSENPTATGDEAQRALMSGRLTGEAGPAMGLARLFRLRKQALEMRRNGTQTPMPALNTPEDAALLADLKTLTSEVQTLLASLPSIAEVRITRVTARVVRTVTREETLT